MSDTRHRDAFGRLVTNPAHLPYADRVDIVRQLAGQLQADDRIEQVWLGRALGLWLDSRGGNDLVALLEMRPERGSRLTPQRLVRREAQARAMRRLVAVAGSPGKASRIATGTDPCPTAAESVLDELRRLNAACSKAAFERACRVGRIA